MVRRFYDVLKELGFEPWLDKEDMAAGDNPHRAMHDGMQSSCAAVFFITPEFQDERFLAAEIEWALQQHTERRPRFRIITLSISGENGQRGVVPTILKSYIYAEPHSELDALREILRALPIRVGAVEQRNG